MPTEFMFGRPLSPEELEFIRTQIEAMDEPSPTRCAIVERNWPHLVSKLPPKDE